VAVHNEPGNDSSSKPNQLGFDLGEAERPRGFEPDREEVRADLRHLLEQIRAATNAPPWDERTFRYNRIVFRQLTRWLPTDEAQQLCLTFEEEAKRIELLYAA
jgi:hypothetical protein